ncbi:MAG: NAD(P)/FAD-dependent oxidoreductase, partial [Candidatus Rokuibacteriota bacterium]
MTRTADVVIVGGGVTGCSIAFHLAEQGVRDVLVLERRFLAAGGTGRSVGVMRQLYPTEATSRMVLHSLRVFQQFREIIGGDAGYVQCGALLAVGPGQRDALAETVKAQRALGIDTRLVGPDDIRTLDPRIDPFAVGAAVWEPESGYGDPTGVTAGYARAAARAGAAIEQGAEVVGLDVAGGRIGAV